MEFKYRTLVNQHQQRVYSLAKHMLGDASEAEDVCQEVFERLWNNIGTVVMEEARLWLLQVARNRCIDYLRKRRDMQELSEDLACEVKGNSPSGHFAKNELSQWLQNAIAKLKEPYKSLIMMADLQQLSIKEIVGKTELSENQIKVYVHRARKQLRARLQGAEL